MEKTTWLMTTKDTMILNRPCITMLEENFSSQLTKMNKLWTMVIIHSSSRISRPQLKIIRQIMVAHNSPTPRATPLKLQAKHLARLKMLSNPMWTKLIIMGASKMLWWALAQEAAIWASSLPPVERALSWELQHLPVMQRPKENQWQLILTTRCCKASMVRMIRIHSNSMRVK